MRNLKIHTAAVLVAISFLCSSLYFAQSIFSDLKREGSLISEGSNVTPVGELKAITYRLETLTPTRLTETENVTPSEYKPFRLTIKTSEPLPMKVFSIWIDGEEIGGVQIAPKSVAVLFHAKSLRNGVSLGLSVTGKTDLVSRSVLPETLYVPPEYATTQEELEVRIILRRVPGSRAGMIQMIIESKSLEWHERCQTTNRGCDTHLELDGERIGLVNYFTPQKFARLRDGAEIILKRGRYLRDAQTVRVLGRLDKSAIR